MLKAFSLISIAGIGVLATYAVLATDGARNDAPDPAVAASGDANTSSSEVAEDLIVHEWGTFTSFSGSDGVQLEFQPLTHNDLPSFVIDPGFQSSLPVFTKSALRAFQRMETPVLYFYTPREMTVDVRVDFPQGLLTEYYPPVNAFGPDLDTRNDINARLFNEGLSNIDWADPEIGGSFLDWGKVTLIPESLLRPDLDNEELATVIQNNSIANLLPYADGNHYGEARATDSALVLTQPDMSDLLFNPFYDVEHFFEKFLFYRGIGNFSLPFEATFSSNDEIQMTNTGTDPIASVFLVIGDGTPESVRFSYLSSLEGGETSQFTLTGTSGSFDELLAAVTQSLVETGLYQKEAESMVATWKDSWFLEPGTRLFYVVPEAITEELLPLTISPQPAETVRILVGRMEMMTPTEEAELLGHVTESFERRVEAHIAASEAGTNVPPLPVPEVFVHMGRWAEPALVRVANIATEEHIRREAEILMRQLHVEQQTAAVPTLPETDLLWGAVNWSGE